MKNEHAIGPETRWVDLEISFEDYSHEIGLESRIAPFRSFVLAQDGMLMQYIVVFFVSGVENYRPTCQKFGSKRDFGIFGEVEGANAGQLGEEAITDPHRYVY